MNQPRLIFYFGLISAAIGLSIYFDDTPPKPPAASADSAESAKAAPAAGTAANNGDKAAAKPEAADPKRIAEQREAARKQRIQRQHLSTIETSLYRAEISNLNTGLVHLRLKGDRFRDSDGPIDLVSTDREEFLPLGLSVDGIALSSAVWTPERLDDLTLVFRTQIDDVQVTRKFQASDDSYGIWVTTTFQNRGNELRALRVVEATHHFVTRADEGGGSFLATRAAGLSNGLCLHAEDMERLPRSDLVTAQSFDKGVRFVGVENAYFLQAIATDVPADVKCTLFASDRGRDAKGEPIGALFSASLVYPEVKLPVGGAHTMRVAAFFGPKMPEDLARMGHGLPEAIDLGFFAQISQGLTWLLREIHRHVPNWGLAIILLTVLVKLLLYPLTERSFRSMARLRQLKPEMDRINELYANDREKKGAAVMELYRKQGINPMGGCLPQLLQLPIWFALYTSLSTNVELFHSPFALWWQDLSAPDPFYVLPLSLGVLMFIQQKITPNTMDPAQAKMMLYMMPVMITAFMLFLPAGLCLYMFTNSALSIGQQKLIERRLATQAPATGPMTPTDSPSDSKPVEGSGDNSPTSSNSNTRRPRRGR